MIKLSDVSETGCCKKFNPAKWNDKIVSLDLLFLKDHVFALFHIPINFGNVLKKNISKLSKYEAHSKDPMILYECLSPFKAALFLSTEKQIPESNMVSLKGEFLSRVFEGDYKNIGTWNRQMRQIAHERSKQVKRMFVYYTTCPRCAQYYGKNYIVLLAQVS